MNTSALKFCIGCKRAVEAEGNRCPECGISLRKDHQNNLFLSGQSGSSPSPANISPGTILADRFKIKSPIANGRYGSVYLANDRLCSFDVALKVIDLGPLGEDKSVLDSRHNVVIRNRISDFSHIIKLYDTHFVPWGATGLLVLSMEHADGGTFREWLLENRENLGTRSTLGLGFFKQGCLGVLRLHEAKIIHLDLKPENMVFSDGILKVSDIGAAVCTENRHKIGGGLSESFSMESATPVYMAPEWFLVSSTDELDERTDIYSLGIILYELLNPRCRPPFEGSHTEVRELHLKARVPPLPGISDELAHVINRCLDKDPSNRYQSVRDLLDDLEESSGKDTGSHPLKSELEEVNPVEVDKTWQRASVSFADGEFYEAERLTEEILSLSPDHAQALRLREELRARFNQADQIYRDLALKIDSGDLSELVEMVDIAIGIYPEHPSGLTVQTTFASKAKRYRKAMEEGLKALQEASCENALEWFQEAHKLHSGAVQLRRIIAQLSQVFEARKKIDLALLDGNFQEAYRLACFVDLKTEQIEGLANANR